MIHRAVFCFLISLVVTLLTGPLFIPFLRKLKFGQYIREEGPAWHQSKSGTPTMGGLIFIAAAAAAVLFLSYNDFKTLMVLYVALAFGIIGFIDDYIKVVLKRNLGLTEKQKLAMQVLAAGIFIFIMCSKGYLQTAVNIPFINKSVDLGIGFYILAALFILAEVNAINFTDGLDGLCSSVTLIVALFFGILAFKMKDDTAMIMSLAVAGGCLGFLFFNKHPAKVFMGDTGSMFLGGALSAIALTGNNAIIFIIAGGIYFIEILSVVLQVISFKTTGKRIFKMSPIHHHFEMSGYSETKIVAIFSTATIILCIIAWMGTVI